MLDNVKTGNFIAVSRKQKGLTQRELAEQLGISDKAVSKWETGKGMPDVSVIPVLCEILSVSSNELLAGERLSTEESFNKKAEENIMELMKSNKKERSRSRWSFSGGLAGLLLLLLYLLALGGLKRDYMIRLIDIPSLFCVVGITGLVLATAGRLGDLFKGIALCFRKDEGENTSDEMLRQRQASYKAVNLAIFANILGGITGTLTASIYAITLVSSLGELGPKVAIALLTLFYGIFFAIILLPVRERIFG